MIDALNTLYGQLLMQLEAGLTLKQIWLLGTIPAYLILLVHNLGHPQEAYRYTGENADGKTVNKVIALLSGIDAIIWPWILIVATVKQANRMRNRYQQYRTRKNPHDPSAD